MPKVQILFFALIILTSCKNDVVEEQIILQQIIRVHFNDLIIHEDLKPIIENKQWIKGKTKMTKQPNGAIIEMPPPPSRDIVVYSLELFDKLAYEEILSKREALIFKARLQSQNFLQLKKINPDTDIKTINLKDLKENYQPHFHISEPLFNEDKTKVLLTIDKNNPGASQGNRYVFELIENKWIQKYIQLYHFE